MGLLERPACFFNTHENSYEKESNHTATLQSTSRAAPKCSRWSSPCSLASWKPRPLILGREGSLWLPQWPCQTIGLGVLGEWGRAPGSERLWIWKWQIKSLLSAWRARIMRHHLLAAPSFQSTAPFYVLICDLVGIPMAQCSQQVLAVTEYFTRQGKSCVF